jgi:diaminopimelate epimerase
MEILNADGSGAEMCGNGIRAVALYLRDRRGEVSSAFDVETPAGMKRVAITGSEVAVDMGPPHIGAGFASGGEELRVAGGVVRFFEVGMGNPHAVIFEEGPEEREIERIGSAIERHPRFPDRTNVEFVRVESPGRLRVEVWERGAGRTLACGTGACAAAVAALATGRSRGEVCVILPGGKLRISWAGAGSSVMMTGPAREVFRGEWNAE